jgi:hypothetical protein
VIPWWAFLPLAALVVTMAVLCLLDGRRRMRRALDEARDNDDGDGS